MAVPNAEQLLAVVEQSPAAVAIHDKVAWMAIFADYHVVEDPVGSSPHIGGVYDGKTGYRGHGALSRFYDTFIEPNNIRFEVAKDYVCGNHVVRDLTIHITMSDKVQVQTPMHLLYELAEENGDWKIQRLAAHWELIPMLKQLFGKGLSALPVMAGLTVRMTKYQGLSGMLGFSKAALSVGKKAKQTVKDFAAAYNARDLAGLMAVVAHDNPMICWPYPEKAVSPSRLFDIAEGELRFSNKMLAAGNMISVSGTLSKNGEESELVALFEFNKKTGKIASLKLYI